MPTRGKPALEDRVVLTKRRKGTIRWKGRLGKDAAYYYGIELDNPTGKHDGCYKNERIFGPTEDDCAVFVPPGKIITHRTPESSRSSLDDTFKTSYQEAYARPTSSRRRRKSKNASLHGDIPNVDLVGRGPSSYGTGAGEYGNSRRDRFYGRRDRESYIDTRRREDGSKEKSASLSYDPTGVSSILGTLSRMGVPGSGQMDKLVRGLGMTTPPQSPTHPASRSKERNRKKLPRGARGLANLGNTCFFNSVVQCLNSNEQLCKLLVSTKTGEEPALLAVTKLASQLQKLMQSIHSGAQESFKPRAMLAAIADTNGGEMYGTGRQQDAHELLIFLLDKLDEEYKENFPSLLLQGRLSSTVTCLACKNPSTKEEEFWSLELDLKSHKSATPRLSHSAHDLTGDSGSSSHETVDPDRKFELTDLLGAQGFTRMEQLQGDNRYYCEKCKKKQKATKQFTIGSPPGTLILHLKRFSYDKYGNEGKKLQNDVSFPRELDLSHLGLMSPESRALQTGYYLRAVVIHKGLSLGRGHYIAYARYKDSIDTWFRYNDSDVTQVKYDTVKDEQAYLLFYDNMSAEDL